MADDPRRTLLLALADDELIIGHRHSEWTGWAPHLEDELALGCAPEEYRNAVLCERPNRDWGYTLARQYLYDTADAVRLETLAGSSWNELADLAKLMQMEETYHLDHG